MAGIVVGGGDSGRDGSSSNVGGGIWSDRGGMGMVVVGAEDTHPLLLCTRLFLLLLLISLALCFFFHILYPDPFPISSLKFILPYTTITAFL